MSAATPATTGDASYATEVARLLWPEPWGAPQVTRTRRRRGLPHRDAYVFPSTRRPRLLVPVDVPGAASMLRRLGRDDSSLAGPARRLLERTVGSPAFALTHWPVLRVDAAHGPADSIEHHLAGCFGTLVRVGVVLGTRRVNQKPVLQIFDIHGRLRGYAKIGHNDLTAELIRHEAAALATVGSRRPVTFRVPEVVHHGQWSGLEVLVLSALTTSGPAKISPAVRSAAMREVADLTCTGDARLAGSGFWARLRADADRLADQPAGRRLGAAAAALERTHGDELVALGGWHGDWADWNMGVGDGVLKVWDWERFDPQVPLGFDGLHHAAQRVRPGEGDEQRQEETFLAGAGEMLAELGVEPGRHDLTLRLYLLEISVRYVDALRHGATPALTRRTEWTLALLERLLAAPQAALVEGRP